MEDKNISEETMTIYDENHNPIEVNVLDIFTLNDYPSKEYILFTKNETENDMVKCYLSILEEGESEINLKDIEDSKELETAQKYIEQCIQEGDDSE